MILRQRYRVLSLLFKDPLFRECFPQFNFQYPIPPRVNSSLSKEMQGRILKVVEQLSDETLISMNGRKSSPWRKMSRSKIPFVCRIVIVINAPFVADLCKAWMMATTILSPAEFIARQREHQSKAFRFLPSFEDPRLWEWTKNGR